MVLCAREAARQVTCTDNLYFYCCAGSDHADGANFGMADGSVHYFINTIDPNVFSLLSSMADGQPISFKD